MIFKVIKSKINGCYQIVFNQIIDNRGGFTKNFHEIFFKELGINMNVAEEYFTYSKKNVFRGLHFQNPPMELEKMVFCVSGKVTDYVVDLRLKSPTYGVCESFELNSDTPSIVFIPIGLAHGFYVKSENAIMQYKVSKVYDPICDSGISYKSFSFANEIENPIISARDENFISFEKFITPFS
ncbi:MAG: dTDP-4-dehydrorhamnose 3,5-epimerase family protein [Bacteroidota bacterium]